jgi:hypothetical protein
MIIHRFSNARNVSGEYQRDRHARRHRPAQAELRRAANAEPRHLERDELSSDRHPALAFCLSMIFSENRFPLFRIML